AAPAILFQDSLVRPKVDIWALACLESFLNYQEEIMIEMKDHEQYFEEDNTFKLGSRDLSGGPRTVKLKELEDIRRDEKVQKELSGDLEILELVLGKTLR
ncbi:hypothetical protein C0992_008481, partial [Termitomyces sp. T32_za158]